MTTVITGRNAYIKRREGRGFNPAGAEARSGGL
jgi:hypothetical protein